MMELVGYPSGEIIEVTKSQFDLLMEEDFIRFDDEWTEATPNGQWGFDDDDKYIIDDLLKI